MRMLSRQASEQRLLGQEKYRRNPPSNVLDNVFEMLDGNQESVSRVLQRWRRTPQNLSNIRCLRLLDVRDLLPLLVLSSVV